MRKAKLFENYSFLKVESIPEFGHSVVRQTTASTFISGGDVLAQKLDVALGKLDADIAAFDHPIPSQTSYRNQLREAVITELGRLAKQLNLDYGGHAPALLSSGLPLIDATTSNAARPVDPAADLMDFELLDGSQAGCLLLKLKRPKGTIQNLIRYATDATLPEDQWHVAVGGGRERQLGPFASGTRVRVKVAALTGSTTEPVYTATKSRLVQ